MIPALRDAAGDLAVRGTPLTVYLHLLYELDPVAFRPVKQLALCRRLQLSERAVRQALNVLVAQRYLERERTRPRGYRLVYARMP